MSLSSATSARRTRAAMRGGDAGAGAAVAEHPHASALEERARPDRLHQPAVEALERRLAEGSPFERREQHQAARRAGRARGLREPIGRLGPERAIDDDEVRLSRGRSAPRGRSRGLRRARR